MNEFLRYLIHVVATSAAMYLLYVMFFKNTTYFKLNRIYLLLSLIIPLIIPLIKIPVSYNDAAVYIPIMLDEIVITSGGEVISAEENAVNYSLWFYSIVSVILVLRIVVAIIRVNRISHNSTKVKMNDLNLVLSKDRINPFSIFNKIYISESHFEDRLGLEQIVSHEKVHIKQLHSLDNLFSEIICSLFWINPIFWIIKDKLKSTHEYLADEEVVEQGFDTAGYFMLLFENVVGKRIGLANNFNESLTLKRMKMMKKKRSPRYLRWLYLLALPLIGMIVFTISCTEEQSKTSILDQEVIDKVEQVEDELFDAGEVDVIPVFGDSQDALVNYLSGAITYPDVAKHDGIEGKVFVEFTISKTGKVVDAKVVESVNEYLDAEALRVISEMPDWIPGETAGKPVNVKFVIPINFKLQ
ncbi:MAG: M56 family metallopeptidase [Bacteroidales bacterium]|nr:M56 family metallopeptidase [Bacteroidales bacterium]